MSENKKTNYNWILSVIVVLLLVIIGEVYYFNTNSVKTINNSTDNSENISNNTDTKVKNKTPEILMITDKRCGEECNTAPIIAQLKQIPSLSNVKVKTIDYSTQEAKDIMKKTGIKLLPAAIFSNNSTSEIAQYLKPTNDNQFSLQLGGDFDPEAEICDNGIDDNNDWKTDCEDSTCSKTLACAPKVDKPKAELFVMSYCPYWTQAQKWYLATMDKLWKVADVEIKYVNYLMHWTKEWQENILQNCIQEEQNDKFYDYLECFLKDDKSEECLKETKIDETKLNSCIEKTKEDINYEENLSKKVWNYPIFTLHDKENKDYWVKGSPTFILNWVKVDKAWRSAKAYADLICNSFKEKPEECEQEFIDTVYDPNFWFTSNWSSVAWGCGQ